MLLRRWAALTVRPLLRYPFGSAALVICILFPFAQPQWGYTPAVVSTALLLFGLGAYLMTPSSLVGLLARRRLLEGAACFLAAIDLGSRGFGISWLHFLAFPLFLIWVYGGYRWRELGVLLLIQGGLRTIGRTEEAGMLPNVIGPLTFLAVWTFFAAAFRSQEKRKRISVTDRLKLYEREATTLENRAEEVQEILRTDDKKRAHLASMVREREESFRNLLEVLFKTFECHMALLYLYDADHETFILKDSLAGSDRLPLRKTQPPDGIFRLLLRESAPIRLVSDNGPLRGLSYYEGAVPVRSAIAVSLRTDQVLKGAVLLDRLEPIPFSEEETEIIEQIARQLARAIDNAEVLHAYFHLKEELAHFYEAASALNQQLHVGNVVDTLLAATRRIIQYDWGVVVLQSQATKTNRIVAEEGSDAHGWVGRTFANAPDRGLVSWVIQNQMPLYYTFFRSRQGKTTLFHKKFRVPVVYESVLILPLQLKGESIGAMLFAARANHFFSRSVRKMLEVTGLQAAASLKNARMVGELEKLATTDGLTGLVNHRTFQETLASEMQRAGRHPASISLLLVDIDHFKKFNDEYGHPVGDFVLKEIAGLLAKTVRKVDTVARYGGEEFAVVLVNTHVQGAAQMAERIVTEVAKSRFQYQGLTLRVTLSVGAATFPDDAMTREDLIDSADRALYEAKGAGRNRAVSYRSSLGKMNNGEVEQRMISSAEDELREMVDLP